MSDRAPAGLRVTHLDHLVLTVRDVEETVRFYTQVLGMERVTFGAGRTALRFGDQKINLHQAGQEFEPKAHRPTPGSGDLCFLTDQPLDEAMAHVQRLGVAILAGPVKRTGAQGPIRSFYIRDPDGNLIEVANRLPGTP